MHNSIRFLYTFSDDAVNKIIFTNSVVCLLKIVKLCELDLYAKKIQNVSKISRFKMPEAVLQWIRTCYCRAQHTVMLKMFHFILLQTNCDCLNENDKMEMNAKFLKNKIALK